MERLVQFISTYIHDALSRVLHASTVLIVLATVNVASAQQVGKTQPDKQQIEYYRDYAVINTNCSTWEEAYEVAEKIVAQGGVVSTLLSPQYFLGWVPSTARAAVENLDRVAIVTTTPSMQKLNISGPFADDVRDGLAHFTSAKEGVLGSNPVLQDPDIMGTQKKCISGEDEKALPGLLSQLGHMTDSVARMQNVPAQLWQSRINDSLQSLLGIPRGVLYGTINVEVFMMESTGPGAAFNWTTAEEAAQISQTIRSFDFLSRSAATFGRSLFFRATWYRPSSTSVVRVTGEPVDFAKADDWRLVKQVMENLGYNNPFGDAGWSWVGSILTLGACVPCDLAVAFDVYPNGLEKEFVRTMKWNDRRAEELRVNQSICLFVKLVPPGRDHRAYARSSGTGYIGGAISIPEFGFRLDLPDIIIGPYAMLGTLEEAPVIAHEISHLFGAPDEYRENASDPDCAQPGYAFRGAANHNCEITNPTSVRSLMRNNVDLNLEYAELSSATPIHLGWISGPARTVRFRTSPPGIPVDLPLWFRTGPTFTDQRDLFLARGFTIPQISVPPYIDISGTRYYFDAWYENLRSTGASSRTAYPNIRSIRIDDNVDEYVAQYTTTGGGITTANNTLEARLGMQSVVAGTSGRERHPGVVLTWRSTLTTAGSYLVQADLGTGWLNIPAGSYVMGSLAPGYYYANISSLSFVRDTYRFRVVPLSSSGAGGVESNVATITMRPVSPVSQTYAYDANEPNNVVGASTVIAFNGSTDSSRTIDAAITYDKQEEFGFYFDADYYAVNASALGGQSLRVTITTKQGSVFDPFITYRPSGASTPVEARRSFGGGWYFDVVNEGITTFSVLPRRGSSDLINLSTGVGNWGEYTINVRPVPPMLSGIDRLCPDCRSIGRVPIGGGRIYPFGTAIPAQRLFTQTGYQVKGAVPFGYIAEADPGFEFSGWEGDFGGSKNPETRSMNPNSDPPGERLLLAKFTSLPQGQYELVYEVPEAWKSVLGESRRIRGGMGDEFDLELPEAAMNGFDFLGWGGTLVESDIVSPAEWKFSPRIRVKLTRHLLVKPTIVPRACKGGAPAAFTHTLLVTTAANESTTLSYGMQPGAGDELEAGQVELPPTPPTPVHDARFLNIKGAGQGSLTDIRALTSIHTYHGRVQAGDNGNPVVFAWSPIPSSLSGTFLLSVGSELVNMRSTTSLRVDVGASSSFTIQVVQDTCRELPKDEFTVAVSDVDASNFPFIRGRICVTDKQGNPIMTVRPSDVMLLEKKGGERSPGILRAFRPSDECYYFEGFIDNSAPLDEKNKQRGLIVVIGLPNPNGQDEEDVVLTLPVPDPGSETGNDNGKPNTAYKVEHGSGWQLVSMPLMLMDSRASAVFGDGSVRSPLYAFDADRGYRTTDVMDFGKGYWLRFSDAGESFVNGLERTIFSISGLPGVGQAAANGWNLIGTLSYDIPLSSIEQTPSNAIISIFEFDNGYKPPTISLKRGKGYWVKLQPSSSLRLVKSFVTGGVGGASKTSAFVTEHERVVSSMPRSLSLAASDAQGSRVDLFLTPAEAFERLSSDERMAAELPPAPPAMGFDARFSTDFSFTPDNAPANLRLQGTAPWRLAAEANGSASGSIDVYYLNGPFIGSIDAGAGGSIVIPQSGDGSSVVNLSLHRSGAIDAAPPAFSLGKNYPNPFYSDASGGGAAGTLISYTVGAEQPVELTVYDILGRAVRTLVRGIMAPGRYSAAWNGRDELGRAASAGTYFYELRSGSIRITRHMVVIK